MNIQDEIKNRILVLDGAMGSLIQKFKLSESDFRGQRFVKHVIDLKGNNDLLNLTKPEVISEIHEHYLKAGADIIETNTFNSNSISMSDYKLENFVYEMNVEGARIAKEAAQRYTFKNNNKPRFIAGSIGPTNRTASMSPDVNDPGYRAVNFDMLASAYEEQIKGLIVGGVDLLLIETVFDTLNCKAAIFAAENCFLKMNVRIPIMVSFTITDASGRTLSGQTPEAFYTSVSHANLFSIGINCAF
ncbi:MAG: homocysteine S-methyltransferase family protein, partial [Bacteroidota bacterium]|nr:homocysteine S-methyltransferase family protein [Bacteroidota bacterium]